MSRGSIISFLHSFSSFVCRDGMSEGKILDYAGEEKYYGTWKKMDSATYMRANASGNLKYLDASDQKLAKICWFQWS